jgi:hypothetical protein
MEALYSDKIGILQYLRNEVGDIVEEITAYWKIQIKRVMKVAWDIVEL